MRIETIVNPKSGRQVQVRAWDVNPSEVIESLKARTFDAKEFSWKLLSDRQSLSTMEREQDGDAAPRNFALAVFEQALDWRLGLRVLGFIRAAAQIGKRPKPFKVAASRRGDVFIITASGRVLA